MKKDSQFKEYAAFYDLLYKDKDYAGEATYIDQLMGKFLKKKKSDVQLLDLACGTGKHLRELRGMGYGKLFGSDISGSMIEVAKKASKGNDIQFFNFSFQDACKINRKFDVITSMFSAVNYITTYEDQSKTLKNIHDLLLPGGLFIFDFWNGNAVVRDYSPVKILRKNRGDAEIMRISETTLDVINQGVTVKFTCSYFEGSKRKLEFVETHNLHYYFFSEIRNLLVSHHFDIVHTSPFMHLKKDLSPSDWNISIIARKKDI